MRKRMIGILLILALIVGTIDVTFQREYARAESDAYMESLDLKWDLAKGKSLPLTANYPGIGRQKFSVKITTYKVENASKEGYNKLTVAYKVTRKWTPTKVKVDKIINTCLKKQKRDYVYLPFADGYTIADYNMGFSLEGEDDYGVEVKSLKGKASGNKKFKGKKKGNWIKIPQNITIKFQVTYPKNYTGLCIGILGANAEYGKSMPISVKSDGVITASDIDKNYFEAVKLTKINKEKLLCRTKRS